MVSQLYGENKEVSVILTIYRLSGILYAAHLGNLAKAIYEVLRMDFVGDLISMFFVDPMCDLLAMSVKQEFFPDSPRDEKAKEKDVEGADEEQE